LRGHYKKRAAAVATRKLVVVDESGINTAMTRTRGRAPRGERVPGAVPQGHWNFSRGDFAPLLTWLRRNIHCQGRRYYAAELVQRVTGRPLSAQPLLEHLQRKAQELYGV
jgi:hypothetical protein